MDRPVVLLRFAYPFFEDSIETEMEDYFENGYEVAWAVGTTNYRTSKPEILVCMRKGITQNITLGMGQAHLIMEAN